MTLASLAELAFCEDYRGDEVFEPVLPLPPSDRPQQIFGSHLMLAMVLPEVDAVQTLSDGNAPSRRRRPSRIAI